MQDLLGHKDVLTAINRLADSSRRHRQQLLSNHLPLPGCQIALLSFPEISFSDANSVNSTENDVTTVVAWACMSSSTKQHEKLNETRTAWSSTLHSRQRVLLHTQPLVALHQKWKLGADEQTHYDALALSIKLFDAVIDGSGFGNEVTHETMLQSLRPLLIAFDEARGLEHDEQRQQQVVDRLIGYLRNDANRGRAFEVEYADFDDDRRVDRKVLRFKLLKTTSATNIFSKAFRKHGEFMRAVRRFAR